MLLKQEYSLNPTNGAGFYDFIMAYKGFGMPSISEKQIISERFLKLIYTTAKDTVTFVREHDSDASICTGDAQLAEIQGGKLVKLWLPGLKEASSNTEFLRGEGVEYVVSAGFPDLESFRSTGFMQYGYELQEVDIQKVKILGAKAFKRAFKLKEVRLPVAEKLGNGSFAECESLVLFDGPHIKKLPNDFLSTNNVMEYFSALECTKCGDRVLAANDKIHSIPFFDNSGEEYPCDLRMPNLDAVGKDCLPAMYDAVAQNRRARIVAQQRAKGGK